jgi:predicted dehydrogenase
MKKYKIGIIGYGGFGKFLHYHFSKLPNVEVIAVADHGHHTKDTTICNVYSNWKELINDPDIDIVSIVTPPSLHAEMACAAMRAGKHVMLEKPVALTTEGAEKIVVTQQETGMCITVDHMIRYNPIIQSLAQLGQSGAVGKLRHAVVKNYAQDESLPVDHWFWNAEMSGGILVEHGVHFFDIINMLGNQKYSEVFGCSDTRNDLQRDRVAAMVRYDDGLIAHYYHAFSGPGIFEQTTIHLAYDLVRIEIEGWIPLKGTFKAMANEEIKAQLQAIPGLKITKAESLDSASDVSRPEGWGTTNDTNVAEKKLTYTAGVGYDVNEIIEGTFEIAESKGDVYGKCVQSTLTDLIKKIENSDHEMTITVEDAVEALEIAILASR